jgi:hypothetical protein
VIPETDDITPEMAENALNVLQRWLADTHAPDNAVWAEARKAIPLVRKFLAKVGLGPPPWSPPRAAKPVPGALQEFTTLEDANRRIRELETTVAAFYGEAGGPLPELPPTDDDSLF